MDLQPRVDALSTPSSEVRQGDVRQEGFASSSRITADRDTRTDVRQEIWRSALYEPILQGATNTEAFTSGPLTESSDWTQPHMPRQSLGKPRQSSIAELVSLQASLSNIVSMLCRKPRLGLHPQCASIL